MRTHLLCFLAGLGSLGVCLGQSPIFTYQGVLRDGSNAPAGVYDFVFRLYDAAENGAPVSAAITNLVVGTSDEGRFTVRLNFGSEVFTGSPRWLAIAVRTNGGGPFVGLSPRQELTATPHALYAINLARNLAGPVAFTNRANTYFGQGSGLTGVNASLLGGLGPGSFWKVGGNTALPAEANFIGTLDPQPFEIRVHGVPAFRLTPGPGLNLVAGGPGNALDKASASFIGGGDENQIHESAYSFIGGGLGNSITNETRLGTIVGGAYNEISRFDFLMPGGAVNSFIGGGTSNVIHLHDSVIAGGRGNRIGNAGATGYETGHFIGGGVDNFISYEISYSTIAGGLENVAAGETTFIGGGAYNLVDWHGVGIGETIAGGEYNYITGIIGYGTIAGGLSNSVVNDWAAIGGGANNTAAGPYSVVPGGLANSAGGFSSFAAGHRAHADHWGTFVWADSSDSDFNSSGEDQFLIRAAGGMGINATNPLAALDVRGRASVGSAFAPSTNTAGNVLNLQVGASSNGSANGISFYEDATGTGMKLGYDGSLQDDNNKLVMYSTGSAPRFVFENGGNLGLGVANPSAPIQHANGASLSAGGVWQNASDVNRKTDFRPVNAAAVLEQLLALPLSSWRYKTEPAGVRHLGPTAQDFKQSFGLGEDDRSIGTVDIDGVALAAIQGLAEKLKQRDQEILELQQAVAELRELLRARPADQK